LATTATTTLSYARAHAASFLPDDGGGILQHLACPATLVPACLALQVTCNMCGCGKWMDAVFTLLATGWWLLVRPPHLTHTPAAPPPSYVEFSACVTPYWPA
jgi:hypothetical protein